jgi:MFS family permease
MTRFPLALSVFAELPADGWLLLATRFARLFAFGLVSVVLVIYLAEIELTQAQIGTLLTLTLLGDIAVSLAITLLADRIGRRRMLALGAVLMIATAAIFGLVGFFPVLLLTATLGILSPSGNEVGPFLALEQSALAEVVSENRHTDIFAWHNLFGAVATATGALVAGVLVQLMGEQGIDARVRYAPIWAIYAGLGLALVIAFLRLSPRVESRGASRTRPDGRAPWIGLRKSGRVVGLLTLLFALDAFGGGFVMQSLMAFWFEWRFEAAPVVLGGIFFAANLLAAASMLGAAAVARRIGLLNTMVFTHLPSNLLLLLVPFMPTLPLAATVLLLRFSISQMDVPTRQAFVMAAVPADERSAAAGVTGIARSIGAAASPSIALLFLSVPELHYLPFLIGGGVKVLYDVLLLWSARRRRNSSGFAT